MLGNTLWLDRIELIRISNIFSRNFEKDSKRLIGRQEVGKFGGLSDFRIEIIMWCFHKWGCGNISYKKKFKLLPYLLHLSK